MIDLVLCTKLSRYVSYFFSGSCPFGSYHFAYVMEVPDLLPVPRGHSVIPILRCRQLPVVILRCRQYRGIGRKRWSRVSVCDQRTQMTPGLTLKQKYSGRNICILFIIFFFWAIENCMHILQFFLCSINTSV